MSLVDHGPAVFAVLVKRLREAAGLSQEELAARARVSTAAVQSWESGRRTMPRLKTVHLVAEGLGASAEDRAALLAAAAQARSERERASTGLAPLPVAPTSLVGRSVERAWLLEQLARPDVRLVTLTGFGGIGKTRLALAAAEARCDAYPDGVAFVGLAPVRDPRLVASTFMEALGLQETSHGAPEDVLCAYLRPRTMLLVVDNLEHLPSAAGLLARILASARSVQLLVTSRASVRIHGEHLFSVPPLGLPVLDGAGPDVVMQSPAALLFVERVRALRPDFGVTAANCGLIAQVCHRLEGLPLALELAAPRARSIPLGRLLAELERRLDALDRGPRDAPDRQRTLRATLDWSHDLLDDDARALFRRLGVFAGGCSLQAAEAVCRPRDEARSEVLDALETLVDQSLLRQDGLSEDMARFSMLETVREYALDQLQASGEGDAVRARHARYFLALAEDAEPRLRGSDQRHWLEQLELEHDNLRAAQAAAAAAADDDTGLRLAAALWRFWLARGHVSEGRLWVEQALARAEGCPDGLRVRALHAAGVLAWQQGDYPIARARFEAGLALSRLAGERGAEAFALNSLGNVAWALGEYTAAQAHYEASLAIRRALDDTLNVAICLNNLGTLASDRGDYDLAWRRHEESLALRRAVDDRRGIGLSLQNLAEVALRRGEVARAEALSRASLECFRALGERVYLARTFDALARIAQTNGQPVRAARLFGAAAGLREQARAPLELTDHKTNASSIDATRAALGAAFDTHWEAGRALAPAQAIDEALLDARGEPD